MKKNIRFVLIVFICFFLSGCYIQSLGPFYTEDLLVELPEINGEWIPVQEVDGKIVETGIKPWVLDENEIRTFNQKGVSNKIVVKYFKVNENIFADITVDYEEDVVAGGGINEWWLMHLTPIHAVARVDVEAETGVILFRTISYEWMDNFIKTDQTDIPFVKTQDGNWKIYTASPQEWVEFLKKYGDSEDVFSPKYGHLMKRYENPEEEGMDEE